MEEADPDESADCAPPRRRDHVTSAGSNLKITFWNVIKTSCCIDTHHKLAGLAYARHFPSSPSRKHVYNLKGGSNFPLRNVLSKNGLLEL
jgi:hypothetical protein